MTPIRSYREFWPHYVREPARPLTRQMHFIGTVGALGLAVLAGILAQPWLMPCALASGYGFAWAAHLFVERNRPATFTYPVKTLIGDFHMFALIWARRMDGEVRKYIKPPAQT